MVKLKEVWGFVKSLGPYITTPFWAAWMAFFAGYYAGKDRWWEFGIAILVSGFVVYKLTKTEHYPYAWYCRQCPSHVKSTDWDIREQFRKTHLEYAHPTPEWVDERPIPNEK